MAMMIMTYRVMPEDGEVEFSELEKVTKETIESYNGAKINSIVEHDVGFGLKAAKVNFSVDEKYGSEELEEKLKSVDEIGDVIVESMSRAMG